MFSSLRRAFVYYGVLGATAVAFIFFLLRRALPDLTLPIGFGSDGLFYHALASAVFNEGWWFNSHNMGFPYGAPFVTFPSNSNVDFAVIWLVGQFTNDAPTAINLSWIFLLAAGGVGCAACLRMLGISSLVSFMAGLLYATMPFGIYRNIGHFSLTPYLLIYPATVALLSFGEGWDRLTRLQRTVLLTGCILLGLNYIYYAFFACLALCLALLARGFRLGKRGWLSPAAMALAIIALTTFFNLVPSINEWVHHGYSPNIRAKIPQEFDYYALKLRHLLTPLWEHSFPPFRSWLAADYNADFPLETENTSARLGFVASVGFIVLLITPLLGRRTWPDAARQIGAGATILSIGLVLYSVMGGLGSLFNLLVAPEIRAANRVTPFIYFFCLVAISLQLDRFKPLPLAGTARRAGHLGLVLCALVLGLIDQAHAFIGLNRTRNIQRASVDEIRELVQRLENAAHGSATVFQLPFTEFLNDNGLQRMGPYDHFRPAVFSSKVRWSYPSMSQQSQLWTGFARTLAPEQLVHFLRASGFNHLWFDRFGYPDRTMEILFIKLLGEPKMESSTLRYAVFNLIPDFEQKPDSQMSAAAQQFLTADLRVNFIQGFYSVEILEGRLFRWSKRDSTIEVSNHGPQLQQVEFRAFFSSLVPGPVNVQVEAQGRIDKLALTNQRKLHSIPLTIAPNSTATIRFHQVDDSFALPHDRRDLYFGVLDPYLAFQNY